jgi:hypothetical protein
MNVLKDVVLIRKLQPGGTAKGVLLGLSIVGNIGIITRLLALRANSLDPTAKEEILRAFSVRFARCGFPGGLLFQAPGRGPVIGSTIPVAAFVHATPQTIAPEEFVQWYLRSLQDLTGNLLRPPVLDRPFPKRCDISINQFRGRGLPKKP